MSVMNSGMRNTPASSFLRSSFGQLTDLQVGGWLPAFLFIYFFRAPFLVQFQFFSCSGQEIRGVLCYGERRGLVAWRSSPRQP